MKATCIEIRSLVIRDKELGKEIKDIAKQYDINIRTVNRIWKLYRETSDITPKPFTGRRSVITDKHIADILDLIWDESDLSLSEISLRLKLPIKKSQLHRLLIKKGYTYKKKSLLAKAQLREDVLEKREDWIANQENLDIKKLVFLDESSIYCGMTPIYGWAHKSERAYEYVIDSRYKRASIISTTRLNGKKATMIIEGSINGEVFEHYVREVLVHTLKKGDIVILDNLSVHKVSGVLDPIYKKGASVMFLPPYSPDFNPIELEWAKIKSTIRCLKPQTYEELIFSVQMAVKTIPFLMVKNWFMKCGYKRQCKRDLL